MSRIPDIDSHFLEPLESAMLSLETDTVPLVIFDGAKSRRFVDQVSEALHTSVVYSSQKDFEAQFKSSLKGEGTLLVLIDQPLAGKTLQIVNGYLAAHDVLGKDNSQLTALGLPVPSDGHRAILVTEKALFARHESGVQRHLADLARVIGVAGG